MAMYLRTCCDGSVNQYHDLYLYCDMLWLSNEQVNNHFKFYGIIFHYHMYGGRYYTCTNSGVGLHKIHSQPGAAQNTGNTKGWCCITKIWTLNVKSDNSRWDMIFNLIFSRYMHLNKYKWNVLFLDLLLSKWWLFPIWPYLFWVVNYFLVFMVRPSFYAKT